jgi:hypothetical protein
LLELTTDPVVGHVKNLTDMATAVGPRIAAIVAAVQETGGAASATIFAGLAMNYPLLPPP